MSSKNQYFLNNFLLERGTVLNKVSLERARRDGPVKLSSNPLALVVFEKTGNYKPGAGSSKEVLKCIFSTEPSRRALSMETLSSTVAQTVQKLLKKY